MRKTTAAARAHVDSLFVSRSYGDKVTVRTYLSHRSSKDSYVISVNGRRVIETRLKSTVRAYIMDHDCQQVESFTKTIKMSEQVGVVNIEGPNFNSIQM